MTTKLTTITIMLMLGAGNLLAAETPSPTPQPDKLKEALGEMITGVTQTAGQAKDFIAGQLPDVVKQLLMWKFAQSLAYCLIGTILILIAIKRISTRIKSSDLEIVVLPPPNVHYHTLSANVAQNGWGKFVIGIIECAVCTIVALTSINLLNLTWLQIWIAPKVYLIEFAKTLIGK